MIFKVRPFTARFSEVFFGKEYQNPRCILSHKNSEEDVDKKYIYIVKILVFKVMKL